MYLIKKNDKIPIILHVLLSHFYLAQTHIFLSMNTSLKETLLYLMWVIWMGCTLHASHINISKLKNHRLSLSLFLIFMYSTIFVSSLLYYIRLHLNFMLIYQQWAHILCFGVQNKHGHCCLFCLWFWGGISIFDV